jgi:hypothetical protein
MMQNSGFRVSLVFTTDELASSILSEVASGAEAEGGQIDVFLSWAGLKLRTDALKG